MATTEIANRFGRLIRRVSAEFSLATTDNGQAKHLIEEWPAIAITLEVENEFLSIRDEIVGNYGDAVQDTWTNYVCLLDNILLRYVSELDKLCQQYLDETPPGDWLIHGGAGVSELENLASSISTAMQLLLNLAWYEIRNNPLSVVCNLNNLPIQNGSFYTDNECDTYPKFEDLFIDQERKDEDLAIALDALRDFLIDNPVLGDDRRTWIGSKKQRGILVDWYFRLCSAGYTVRLSNNSKIASLLNSFFTNLELGKDGSNFRANSPHNNDSRWRMLIASKSK